MDKDLKQYLDEQFGRVDEQFDKVNTKFELHADRFDRLQNLIENFATATAQRFDELETSMDKRFDEVDERLEGIEGRLGTVETNTEIMAREQRALREELEENVKPRISNLEAQVNRA